MKKTFKTILTTSAIALCSIGFTTASHAEQRITFKAAKTGTSYYQMGVELANAVKAGSDGNAIITLEESQGSVQNVMEAGVRTGNYTFTSPPGLVKAALAGKGAFEKRPKESFAKIRSLFPIPSLTMHFILHADKPADSLDDLADNAILLGKGTFGATEGEKYLKEFGIFDKVKIASAELGNAADALKNGQIDGFVTAGSFPAPNVIQAAASSRIALIPLTDEQIKATGRPKQIIPAGTYAGVDYDVATTFLPVVAYATTDMDDDTAYLLTKIFWEQKEAMSETSPWWKAVSQDTVADIGITLHPGALKYYEEAGVEIPQEMR